MTHTATDRLQVACPHCGRVNRLPAARAADDPACGSCGAPLLPGEPVDVDDAAFDKVVAGTDLPVLVDFWAAWCGPCRAMAPAYAEAARRLKGRAVLLKVDSDRHPATAARFGIRSIPTLVRLDGGRETRRQSGAVPAAAIVALAGG